MSVGQFSEQKLRLLTLPCGIELATEELPERHAVALDIRFLGGTAAEPEDRLGLARLVEVTLDKGTESRTGRQLSDDFDRIGARQGSWTGREAIGFGCLCLPEFFGRCVELFSDFLQHPTLPEDVFRVHLALTRQELTLLEDDPQALTERALDRQAWGPVLGRHSLGEPATLDRISRDDLVNFWQAFGQSGRMQVAVAGPIDSQAVADTFQRCFEGFGASASTGREGATVEFNPVRRHYHKELEQQQIGMCFRGVDVEHPEFPAETALVKILSGGMSSRLFTEVREKRGLVYWVGAWQDQARGAGMIGLGASSTPDNCEETYRTLLREIERVQVDLTQEELDRALAGIIVRAEIGGDVTRVRCGELASDLFHRGRLITRREKLARLMAVKIPHIHAYLDHHRHDAISVVTYGPKEPKNLA